MINCLFAKTFDQHLTGTYCEKVPFSAALNNSSLDLCLYRNVKRKEGHGKESKNIIMSQPQNMYTKGTLQLAEIIVVILGSPFSKR